MKIYGDEKPSLQELAHYGTKGMKWGVRRAQRKERNAQIKGARQRIASKQAEVHSLARQSSKAKTAAERARLDKLATKKAKELFESPDHLTASRMTSGEKWMTGVLLGTTVAVGAASAGLGTRQI